MTMKHHIGSFQPTPLSRIAKFMGLSLGIHLVLLGVTSIGYLMEGGEAAAEEAGAQAPAEAETDPKTATGGEADGPSADLPRPTEQRDATEAFMEAQDGTEEARTPGSLELFE